MNVSHGCGFGDILSLVAAVSQPVGGATDIADHVGDLPIADLPIADSRRVKTAGQEGWSTWLKRRSHGDRQIDDIAQARHSQARHSQAHHALGVVQVNDCSHAGVSYEFKLTLAYIHRTVMA
jgi:hypothetical protein